VKSPHLLLASTNPRRLKAELSGILETTALDAIEGEIRHNVRGLFRLALRHFSFATGPATSDWRQAVSRLYYAAYAASRAIRLEVDGHYTTEPEDHRRVGDLPNSFTKREQFKNQLEALREDRNLADYDHSATEKELIFSVDEATDIVKEFLELARRYLGERGAAL
jgi:uncharacterized protein (UPF0332 family)